jgi:2-dehydropantoate 2-reductase
MSTGLRFAVVGAGAIGAYVGAALSAAGSEVTLIARGAHLHAMQERGVRVLSQQGDFEAHPAATDDIAAIGDADVIFLALKAYSLPSMAPSIAAAMQPGASLVCAQNGLPYWYFQHHGGGLEGTTLESVDPGGVIAQSMPDGAAVGCVVYCAAEIVEPGVIRHAAGTRLLIGEPDGTTSERCVAIAGALGTAGFTAPIDDRIRDQIWLKLIGNVACNPVSALTGATLGGLGRSPAMVQALRAMFDEVAGVTDRLGVEYPISLDQRLQDAFAVGDHKPSMLMDREAGKPLEHECMTGAVVELARLVDVQVPRIEALHACVSLVDAMRV